MITESEAKKKWCPMVVVSATDPREKIKAKDASENWRHPCIGSECMAWRTSERQRGRGVAIETIGYCGMTGKR